MYFSVTEWRTIDQGLSRLLPAFGPLVLNRTIFPVKVQEMEWNERCVIDEDESGEVGDEVDSSNIVDDEADDGADDGTG